MPEIHLVKRKYDPDGGGAERVAARFVNGFLAKGWKIVLYGETCSGPLNDRFHWVRVKRSPFSCILGGTWAFHQAVRTVLKSRPSSGLTYAMSRTFPVDVYRVAEQLHADWMEIGYHRLHRFNPRHRGILKLDAHLFRPENVAVVVTNSVMIRNRILARYPYPEDRIRVVRNGVDHEMFFPLSGPDEKIVIRNEFGFEEQELIFLFVAENFRIKGLAQACTAMAGMVSEPGKASRLVVVGGDDPAPYRSLISRLGIDKRVTFLGKRSDMRNLYAMADLLVYPSLFEPFANVCLEAAACGLPVLTTALNGASELVEHGKNGYIIKNADSVRDLRECLDAFVCLGSEARRDAAAAAFRASVTYTWARHIDELETVFFGIMEEKRRRPGLGVQEDFSE